MSEAARPASTIACLVGPTVAVEQVVCELLELRARQLQVEVLRPVLGRGDERQVDLRRHRRRQLDLRLLAGLVQALERHRVDAQVDALVALELRDHPVDDRLVEVVAAEMVVAVRGLHLEDALAELEHGHVERAAAEVEDENRLVGAFLVEPVGECSRGRLVDDPDHVEAGDAACILGRLALRVVEVRRDGDHRVGDRLAEVGLSVGLQLLQDHRADLRRCVLLAAGLHADVVVRPLGHLVGDDLHLFGDLVELAAHEPLDREDRVLRVRDLLPPRRGADEPLVVLREADDRRCGPSALGIRDHRRLATLEHGHTRVGRPEVNSQCFRHFASLLLSYIHLMLRKSKSCYSRSLEFSGRCRSARRRRPPGRPRSRGAARRARCRGRARAESPTPHSDSVATSGETTVTRPRQ